MSAANVSGGQAAGGAVLPGTGEQPHAQLVLASAVGAAAEPSHAHLFHGRRAPASAPQPAPSPPSSWRRGRLTARMHTGARSPGSTQI